MTCRERLERHEAEWLAPWATKSAQHGGRVRAVSPDDLRTEFQRDRDRILHAKAFRRLKHKTQCFLSPEGDHYRTRLTHTLEVSQIARTLARALRLNEDLPRPSRYHDLGHTPLGTWASASEQAHARGVSATGSRASGGGGHRARRGRAEPDGCGGEGTCTTPYRRRLRRWKASASPARTASPISTTTSTTRFEPACSGRRTCPGS